MVNIKVEPQRFEIMKEKVKRSLQNFRREVPYQMVHFGVTYLTAEYQWNKDELLSCIDGRLVRFCFVFSTKFVSCSEGITIHDLESFIPRMLTRFYTDSLMYGNLTKDVRITSLLLEKRNEFDFVLASH